MSTFLKALALMIAFVSSVFLIKGSLALSTNDIVALSSTKWSYDLAVAKNLCHQRSDTLVGFSLLFLSFILQLCNMFWKIRKRDFSVNGKGIVWAFTATLLLFLISYSLAGFLFKASYKQVEQILKR